jgi:hypothetical protein
MASGMEMVFVNAVKLIIAKIPEEEKAKLAGAIDLVLSFGNRLDRIEAALTRIEQHLGSNENDREISGYGNSAGRISSAVDGG